MLAVTSCLLGEVRPQLARRPNQQGKCRDNMPERRFSRGLPIIYASPLYTSCKDEQALTYGWATSRAVPGARIDECFCNSILAGLRRLEGSERQNSMIARTLTLAFLLGLGSVLAQSTMRMPEEVGHVRLQNSCSSAVAADLDRGLSLYYSFWYDEARANFDQAAKVDPNCAMAYWGQAVSEYQPVETLPEGDQLKAGRSFLVEAHNASEQTPRERRYVDALSILFDTDALPKSGSRAVAYSDAMRRLHLAFPTDSTGTTL